MIIQSIINMSVDIPTHILIIRIIIWWFMFGVLPWQLIHLRSWCKTHRDEIYKRDVFYICIFTGPIMVIPSLMVYKWKKQIIEDEKILKDMKK